MLFIQNCMPNMLKGSMIRLSDILCFYLNQKNLEIYNVSSNSDFLLAMPVFSLSFLFFFQFLLFL